MDWEPSDFLLTGSYCPKSSVEAFVRRERAKIGCSWLLIMAASESAILRSFSIADGPAVSDSVSSAWPRIARKSRLRKSIVKEVGNRVHDVRRSGHPAIVPVGSNEIVDQIVGCETFDTISAFLDHGRNSGTGLRFTTTDLEFLAFTDAEDCDQALGELVRGYAVRASATILAAVHRDARRAGQVDDALRSAIRHGHDRTTEILARLAIDVTSSDVCVFYKRDVTSGELVGYATAGDESLLKTRVGETSEGQSAAWEAFQNGKAVQLVSTNGSQVSFTAELAIGIPGPSASFATPPLGVLAVARSRPSDLAARFGSQEYAYVRNLALRKAVLNSTDRTGEVGPAVPPVSISAQMPEAISRPFDTALEPDPETPLDVKLAIPSIESTLERLVDLSSADSATFRAVVGAPGFPAGSEFDLVRVVAVPPTNLADPRRVIASDEQSQVADTAKSGVIQNESDTSSRRNYMPVRPSASELSVPVFVEGLVVGVVNLESRQTGHFVFCEETAASVSSDIGVQIANARLQLARPAQKFAQQALARTHRIIHVIEETRKKAPDFFSADRSASAEISGALKDVFGLAKEMRHLEPDANPDGCELSSILALALERAGLPDEQIKCRDDALERPVPESLSSPAFSALIDIASNVQRHSSLRGLERSIGASVVKWSGREYAAVHFMSRPRFRPPGRPVDMYKVPFGAMRRNVDGAIRNSAELRLGCFLAGLNLRSIGGDAYMTVDNNGRVNTLALVPIGESGGDVNG